MAGFDRVTAQGSSSMARSPVAWTLLLGLALIKLGIHLLSGMLTYGYMTDELYYLDCADHLAWGYVDHPPLSVALLALVRLTIGDSLIALRLVPALAGSATIVLVGLMARELGGGRVAQGLAALAALVAPVYFGIDAFYSMNAFEPALWALAAYLLLRLENGALVAARWCSHRTRAAEQTQHDVVRSWPGGRSAPDAATPVVADAMAVVRRRDRAGAVCAPHYVAGTQRLANAGVHAQPHAVQDAGKGAVAFPRRAGLNIVCLP